MSFLVLYAHVSFCLRLTSTLFELGEVDFGQVLMFGFSQFIHAIDVLNVSGITFDEGFFVVHDVFIWRVFEAVYFDGTEMRIFYGLDELQFL